MIDDITELWPCLAVSGIPRQRAVESALLKADHAFKAAAIYKKHEQLDGEVDRLIDATKWLIVANERAVMRSRDNLYKVRDGE